MQALRISLVGNAEPGTDRGVQNQRANPAQVRFEVFHRERNSSSPCGIRISIYFGGIERVVRDERLVQESLIPQNEYFRRIFEIAQVVS
jgi:hypothetical protein